MQTTATKKTEPDKDIQDRIAGVLLGTLIGDAMGLPYEGLSRRRAKRLFPGKLRYRFLFGRGMVSDDTEHTDMVAQSLLDDSTDAERFAKKLARRLRWWVGRFPAGVGWATLRACLKLWCGCSPKHSGVFSAGNGPAMRSAVFGAVIADDVKRAAFVEASTRLTHTDPKALIGAMAVTEIVRLITKRNSLDRPPVDELLDMLRNIAPQETTWCELLEQMQNGWANELTVTDFADRLGLQKGVSGYVFHTVPVAVYAWYRHFGDFRQTLESVIECGGDTDTAGAIAGAMSGVTVTQNGIPNEWLAGLCDWPINVKRLRQTAMQLSRLVETGESPGNLRCFWPAIIPRNLLFLCVVLVHGFRRLAPPY